MSPLVLGFSYNDGSYDRSRRMAGSAILSIAYGFDPNLVQDSVYTENAERAMDGFIAASVPGSFLVVRSLPLSQPTSSFIDRILPGLLRMVEIHPIMGPRSFIPASSSDLEG